MPASAHNASPNSSTPSPDSRPQTGHPAATIVHTRPLKAAHPPHSSRTGPRHGLPPLGARNFCPPPRQPSAPSLIPPPTTRGRDQERRRRQNIKTSSLRPERGKPQGTPHPHSLPLRARPRPRYAGHNHQGYRQEASGRGTATAQAETTAQPRRNARGNSSRPPCDRPAGASL